MHTQKVSQHWFYLVIIFLLHIKKEEACYFKIKLKTCRPILCLVVIFGIIHAIDRI